MKKNLFSYMADVKSQLFCNSSQEEKDKYVTYLYQDDDIDAHISYFNDCLNQGMSAHTALELFNDHYKHIKSSSK